ncbi:TetR/AcrR family transcriptional regulator C-terminal domain-containing protein [Actinacidiphila glaucinigra]|uniref:TetR/AcrR family transcriptional regulator C-terminal domain-containing protein n=1 Tax=Actinacidiphila glaucinigra TaxID=235986 RepID=UPI0035E1B5B1
MRGEADVAVRADHEQALAAGAVDRAPGPGAVRAGEAEAVQQLPGRRGPRYDTDERQARLGGEFPLVGEAGREMFDHYDARFETGLRILVAGIQGTLAPDGAR